MFQICDHILHILITAVNTLLCTFQNDLFQTVWQFLCVDTRRDHLFLKMLDSDCYCCIPVEWNLAGNHLIHGDTK